MSKRLVQKLLMLMVVAPLCGVAYGEEGKKKASTKAETDIPFGASDKVQFGVSDKTRFGAKGTVGDRPLTKPPQSKGDRKAAKAQVEELAVERDQEKRFVAMMDARFPTVESLNVKDARGSTPLHQAAVHGWHNAVDYLLKRGADPSVKDAEGLTASDWARKSGYPHIEALIAKYTPK